jgi:GntR family transcriptional regulator, carbon starvation induced regulator
MPGEAKTLIDTVYARLRADVITGRLAPGIRLKVERLRDEFGVGASTMREALTRLCADGLAVSEGQRGFRVASVSLADLMDVTSLRQLLETRALREAIAKGDEAWREGVETAYRELSAVEARLHDDLAGNAGLWEARNRDFHRALGAACASRRTLRFIDILYNQHERYRRLSLITRSLERDIHAEHQGIFEATMAREADLACRLTEEHIARTAELLAAGIVDGAWFGLPGGR